MERAKEIKDITDLLDKLNISYYFQSLGKELFERVIVFNIRNNYYKIEWFTNQCYLKDLKNSESNWVIPFRYIYHDTTYPLDGTFLGFFDTEPEKDSLFGHLKNPFGAFRIKI